MRSWTPRTRTTSPTNGTRASGPSGPPTDCSTRGEDGLTLDDMTELQVDTAMGRARNAAIWLMSAEPATDDGRIVLDRILDWDGACDIDSLGCAAWSMFEYRLHRDVFDDDLGPLARDYVGTPPAQMLIDALFDDPEATWWDDASTPNRETSAEIVGARPRRGRLLARDVVRRTDQLDLGPRAHRDLPGGDDRLQRDRPAGVVLQRRPARGRRGLRSA